MATANASGAVAFWNLEEQILIGQKTDMHSGRITSMNFAIGTSNLYTTGVDNKISKWILRNENSMPELVKAIEGPTEPVIILFKYLLLQFKVTAVAFFGPNSLLFSSKDGIVRQFMDFTRNNTMKSMGVASEVRK